MKKRFLLIALFLLFPVLTWAQAIPTMEFFHGAECPHCHEEKAWFPELKKMYPDIDIQMYEIWHDTENQALYQQRLRELGQQPQGVPTNIIQDEVVVGFQPQAILALLEKHYGPPADTDAVVPMKDGDPFWQSYLKFPWPVMSFVLGLVDGFNPCAMWSLFVLLGFLLGMERSRDRWIIGGVFVGSSALIYLAALITYLLGFQAITSFVATTAMGWIFRIVGALAVITGLIIVFTARRAGIDCTVRDAESKKKFHDKLQTILQKDTLFFVLLGVVGLAFSVNAIELLCSFAIPTAFTATLTALDLSWSGNAVALLLYDLAYILDDVLVLVIALWTMNLKIFSPKITQGAHFVGGILLLILGLGLLINPTALTSLLT